MHRYFGCAALAAALATPAEVQAQEGPAGSAEHLVGKLLETARTGDREGFDTLIGPSDPDDPLSSQAMLLGDYRETPEYFSPIDFERIRTFATSCHFVRLEDRREPDPLGFVGRYNCNGKPDYLLAADMSIDRQHLSSFTIVAPDPEGEERLAVQWAQTVRADRRSIAKLEEEEARLRKLVDALFTAARAGDRAQFASLVAGGARLVDLRSSTGMAVPLTPSALRPIADRCRRADEESMIIDRGDRSQRSVVEQEAWLICAGRRTYMSVRVGDGGTRIISIQLEGEVRQLPAG